MGTLQTLINQHRAALLAREQAASQDMARYYDTVWQRIYTRLDELLGKMRDAQDAGADIKVSWLYEHDRLRILQADVAQQIDLFARYAGGITRNLGTPAVQSGVQDAMALLRVRLGAAPLSFTATPHGALSDLVGAFQDGSPVSALFDSFGPEAAQSTKDALTIGVALGKNPVVIARDVQSALSVPLSRAIVIAQNESMRAYRSSSLATYRANSDVVEGWIWSADLGGACVICTDLNGSFHSLDEDMVSHVRCRCSPVPQTKSWSALGFDGIEDTPLDIVNGADWFAEQDASVQDSILGKKAGAAYRNGDVSLQDFVGVKHDPQWGDSRYQKSLKEALANAN